MHSRSGLLSIIGAGMWTAVVFVAGWFIGAFIWQPAMLANATPASAPASNAQAQPSLYDEAWSRVRDNFVGQVPTDTVRDYAAIRGAFTTLGDRYTFFIEPQARTVERDHMRGQFGGIGVTFLVNDQGFVVLTPRASGSAENAGIRAGDRLVRIDGVALPRPAKADDVAPVRGEVGTPVRIGVLRGESTTELEFTVTRELVQVASVEWRVVTRDGGTVGVIQIRQFTERTGVEVTQALTELRAAGVRGYVLDLRDNGGGLLAAAVDVVSEFLDRGIVLIEHKRDAQEVTYTVRDDKADKSPLAVLINKGSASASEVVAGALRDHQRGKLIGETSYGKGSVQLIFDLTDGSSVHVTTAKWVTPNRTVIDGAGLKPDIELFRAAGEAEAGVDTQLDKAVGVVLGQ